jgi:hypothetical protein
MCLKPPSIGTVLVSTHGPFQADQWTVVDTYQRKGKQIISLVWDDHGLDVQYDRSFWTNWQAA